MSNELAKINASETSLRQYAERLKKPAGDPEKCELCKSPFRKEAEDKFEETKSLKAVEVLLKEKKAGISYWSVRRHLIRHYLATQRAERLQDYANDVLGWLDNSRDKKTQYLERIAILERRMYSVELECEGQSFDVQCKGADIIKKLNDGIIAIEDKLIALDRDNDPVLILWDTIKKVLVSKVKGARSEDSKRDLMDVLDEIEKAYETATDTEEK